MMDKRKSIRSQLIKLILVISSLSLLVAFTALFTYEIISYRRTTLRELRIIAHMLAQNSTAALAFENTDEAAEILASLRAEKYIIGAALYRENNTVFTKVTLQESERTIPDVPKADGTITTRGYFEIYVPVVQADKRLGTLYVIRGTEDIDERLELYLVVIAVVLVLCFLLTYLLSKRFEKSISGPIINLARTATQISQQHDYSLRVVGSSGGEIGILTDAFNEMVTRIERQNSEIQQHAQELELKVSQRTLELQRQKDFAETVLNSSLVLIAVFDTDTRFIAFNKRCEIEFGMKREDVLGKRYAEAMPQVVGSMSYKSVLRALNGETVHNPRYRSHVSGDFYESFTIPLVNEKKEVYAAILSAHNITEVVNITDKLLVSNEELKKKNSELEQFAYVASHDLQEPLRKIQVFADFAKRQKSANTTDYLSKIEMSAERMSRLIKDVLEYSKLSKVEESFVDTDLNIILEYVRSDFELLIAEKNVTIESNHLPMVRGNKLQLHQLFANLISNAIKFTDQRPVISIKAQPAEAADIAAISHLDKAKKYSKILFTDNGIGFDPQFQDKVFTIFQRLNTREKFEGTGIGLALCKKIVENHNGHISVTSGVGLGTTFTVIIPTI